MAETEKIRSEVTTEQLEAAFSGPAPAVNKFVINLGPTGLRISFLEEHPEIGVRHRASVTMHPQDGMKLYKLIQEMLKDIEEQLSALEVENDGGE